MARGAEHGARGKKDTRRTTNDARKKRKGEGETGRKGENLKDKSKGASGKGLFLVDAHPVAKDCFVVPSRNDRHAID